MRPMHEILAAAKTHLWHPGDSSTKMRRICVALSVAQDEGELTEAEAYFGAQRVMQAVHDMRPGAPYLLQAALWTNRVSAETTAYDPAYIEFRDKWLDDLIEQVRREAT